MNTSLGAGLCLGPFIGSLVFRWLDYVDTFYFFTIYIFTIGMATIFVLPSRVNNVVEQTEDQ